MSMVSLQDKESVLLQYSEGKHFGNDTERTSLPVRQERACFIHGSAVFQHAGLRDLSRGEDHRAARAGSHSGVYSSLEWY